MRANAPKGATLVIAGAYEMLAPPGMRQPEPAIAPRLAQAYDRLGYDIGLLAPEESVWLRDNSGKRPGNWAVATERPVKKIITAGGLKLGLVIFPSVNLNAAIREETYREVLAAAASLKGQVNLVIGMSLWGSYAESKLLEIPGQNFDLLLGSGPGNTVSHDATVDGRTIWLRPYFEGKSVIKVEILDPAAKSHGGSWVKDKNFTAHSFTLDDNYPADPEILAIFKK